jgi:16S rRNA processing protein RimM
MEDFLRIGVITSTHGLKGEVKVFPTTDDQRRFKRLREVTLVSAGNKLPLNIAGVKFFKQFVILKFEGIDTLTDVEKYKGCELYVERGEAVPLDPGEYYIGIKVFTEDGKLFGTLKDVMETGANDVYIVEPENGKDREVLIPAIHDCILDVDTDHHKMVVHLLEGLL